MTYHNFQKLPQAAFPTKSHVCPAKTQISQHKDCLDPWLPTECAAKTLKSQQLSP